MTDILLRTNISYGTAPAHVYDCYIPQSSPNELCQADTPALLIVDNGWWTDDTRQAWTLGALALAQRGLAVAVISYRPLGRTGNGRNLLRDITTGIECAHRDLAASGAAHLNQVTILGCAGGSVLTRALTRQEPQADVPHITSHISLDSRYTWAAEDEQFRGSHADELDPSINPTIPQLCIEPETKTLADYKSTASHDLDVINGSRENILAANDDLITAIAQWLLPEGTNSTESTPDDLPIGEAAYFANIAKPNIVVEAKTE